MVTKIATLYTNLHVQILTSAIFIDFVVITLCLTVNIRHNQRYSRIKCKTRYG